MEVYVFLHRLMGIMSKRNIPEIHLTIQVLDHLTCAEIFLCTITKNSETRSSAASAFRSCVLAVA
jgi:hypothetical protein